MFCLDITMNFLTLLIQTDTLKIRNILLYSTLTIINILLYGTLTIRNILHALYGILAIRNIHFRWHLRDSKVISLTFNVLRMSFELFTPIVFVVTVIARYCSYLLFSCDVEYCRCYSMLLLLSNNVVLFCFNFCLQLFLFDVVVLLLFLFVRSNFGCCLFVAGMIYTSCFCQS